MVHDPGRLHGADDRFRDLVFVELEQVVDAQRTFYSVAIDVAHDRGFPQAFFNHRDDVINGRR